jgi:hypothetical protein
MGRDDLCEALTHRLEPRARDRALNVHHVILAETVPHLGDSPAQGPPGASR